MESLPDPLAARRAALATSLAITLITLSALVVYPETTRTWLATIALMLALVPAMLMLPPRAWSSFGGWIFLFLVGVASAETWINNNVQARAMETFEPFMGFKLVAVFVAVIAPEEPWVGLASVVLVALLPIAEFYGWPEPVRHHLPRPEPYSTLQYAVMGAILLVHRRRQLIASHELARAQAHAQREAALARITPSWSSAYRRAPKSSRRRIGRRGCSSRTSRTRSARR